MPNTGIILLVMLGLAWLARGQNGGDQATQSRNLPPAYAQSRTIPPAYGGLLEGGELYGTDWR